MLPLCSPNSAWVRPLRAFFPLDRVKCKAELSVAEDSELSRGGAKILAAVLSEGELAQGAGGNGQKAAPPADLGSSTIQSLKLRRTKSSCLSN